VVVYTKERLAADPRSRAV